MIRMSELHEPEPEPARTETVEVDPTTPAQYALLLATATDSEPAMWPGPLTDGGRYTWPVAHDHDPFRGRSRRSC